MQNPYGNHLPIFPTFYTKPDESRLEFVVERLMDNADRAFLNGKATRSEYEAWVKALDLWASKVETA